MRDIIRLLSTLSILLLLSCRPEVASFRFAVSDSTSVRIYEEPGQRSDFEGRYIELRSLRATPLYTFAHEVAVGPSFSGVPEAFRLVYACDARGILELHHSTGEVEEIGLPPTGNAYLDYRIPISEGSRLSAFRIRAGELKGELRIDAVGLGNFYPGFRDPADGTVPMLGHGFRRLEEGAGEGIRFEFPDITESAVGAAEGALDSGTVVDWYTGPAAERMFDGTERTGTGSVVVQISYRFEPSDISAIDTTIVFTIAALSVRSGGTPEAEPVSRRIELIPKIGERSFSVYSSMIGFAPGTLVCTDLGRGFEITGIRVLPALPSESWRGLSADLGSILEYDRSWWRRAEFEIFSWNLYPDILVVDTADYAVQANMFTRLAFYVEKAGSVGTIIDESMIPRLHGWNAHDYRAEDLARFFNDAATQEVALTAGESALRRLLILNGVLDYSPSGLSAVSGGILSISRQSSDYLRRLFARHEGYHGVFFADTEYREECFKIWNSLAAAERRFWRGFLRWKGYDSTDEYLTVNEYQAYIMQQAEGKVNGYYTGYIIPSYLEKRPQETDLITEFLATHPNTFIRSAEMVNRAVFETTGIPPSGLFCIDSIAPVPLPEDISSDL
jgi:hypothetical protein